MQLTPFQCVLGYQLPLFPWNAAPTNSPAIDDWFRRNEGTWESMHQWLEQVEAANNRHADRRGSEPSEFHPGDHVWLPTHDLHDIPDYKKLLDKYMGLFKVLCQELPRHSRLAPSFHVLQLKAVTVEPHPRVFHLHPGT